MNKETVGTVSLKDALTDLQKDILRLAHERFLCREELSFGEILITLYGSRPARMGPLWVHNFTASELVAACRSDKYDRFHFATEIEKESYLLDHASAVEAVSALAAKGLLAETRQPRIIWHSDRPLVKRIEYYSMIRLTNEGKKAVGERRRHPRHALSVPAECSPARFGDPRNRGLAVDVSEEGVGVDLCEKLHPGQKITLTLGNQGLMEIIGRIVWARPGGGEGEPCRYGVRIRGLSRENIQRLARLLAAGSGRLPAPFLSAPGTLVSC